MKKSNPMGRKAGEFIDLHRDLNIHDPNNQYQWADAKLPWQSQWLRAVFVGLLAALTVFGLLL